MENYNFIACDSFDNTVFEDIEKFVNSFPDFQTVFLKNESELNLLLNLIEIRKLNTVNIEGTYFSKYWDLSDYKFPEYNEEQFDLFYKKWLKISNRDNNMDEFGNLVFLRELTKKWNKLSYRLVVKELN